VGSAADLKNLASCRQKEAQGFGVCYGRPDFYAPHCADVGLDVFFGFFIPVATQHHVAVHEEKPLRGDVLYAFLAGGGAVASVHDDFDVVVFIVEFSDDLERVVFGVAVHHD